MRARNISFILLVGFVTHDIFANENTLSNFPQWHSQKTPNCSLIYENPTHGKAVFHYEKPKGLGFYWEPVEKIELAKSLVDMESVPPVWRNDIEPEYLGFSRTMSGPRLFELSAPQTSVLLLSLKKGSNIHMKVRLEKELIAHMDEQSSESAAHTLANYEILNSNFLESLAIFDQCSGLGLLGPQDQTVKRQDQIVRVKKYVQEIKGDTKAILAPSASEAVIKSWKFSPDPKQNRWELAAGPFACRLSQKILNFGDATFYRKSGAAELFVLEATEKNYFADGEAKIETMPHTWRPTQIPLSVGRAESHKGVQALSLDAEPLMLLAVQLSLGTQILVSAPSYSAGVSGDGSLLNSKSNFMRVILDSQNFKLQYKKFQQCSKDLIQTTFAQVARTQINFAEHFSALSESDRAVLKKIAIYANADPNVLSVFVDAHTDDVGTKDQNMEVSKKVASSVADFLKESGVNEAKITSRSHAEKFPIGDNRTPEGRAKNRRVTIRLIDEQARAAAEKAVAEHNARESLKAQQQSSLPSHIAKKLQEIHQAESGQGASEGSNSSNENSSKDNKKVTADDIRKLIEGLNAIDGH